MCPSPRHHRPHHAAVHQPYIPSDPAVAGAAFYPQSSAAPYSPSQIANPTTRFYPPPYPTVTAAATGISGYPLSSATPYRPPQNVIPTTQFYPTPYPTVAATETSNYTLSTATLYRPPRPVIPTTRFYPTPYPTVSATRNSDLSTAANSATPYRPPQTAIPTTLFRPIPPYSAAANHPPSRFTNRPITRPDLAAVPISGEDYQRRLRNESIFLHGLWHQGPPNSNPNSSSAVNNPISNFHLKPAPSTTFKKKRKKKKKKNPISDIPWPVPPDSTTQAESDSAWREFPPVAPPSIGAVSEEEKARVLAIRVQKRALNSVQNFFARKYGPESEIDSDEDEDDGSDDHGYLTGIFEGDDDLRSYYENNWRKGEFLCLVCGGSGKKLGKKFKDCVALVQHTITILKTKKRVAHRAYGQVICKLLRWDIHNLPSVAENPSNQQGGDSGKVESGKDDVGGPVANTVLSVNENEQSNPSKSSSIAGDDVPPISEDPGAQQLNDANKKSETADGNPAAVHKVSDREL